MLITTKRNYIIIDHYFCVAHWFNIPDYTKSANLYYIVIAYQSQLWCPQFTKVFQYRDLDKEPHFNIMRQNRGNDGWATQCSFGWMRFHSIIISKITYLKGIATPSHLMGHSSCVFTQNLKTTPSLFWKPILNTASVITYSVYNSLKWILLYWSSFLVNRGL